MCGLNGPAAERRAAPPAMVPDVAATIVCSYDRNRYAYYDFNVYGDVGPDTFKQTLLFGLSGGYETHNFTRWLFQGVTGAPISVYNPLHGLTTYPVTNATTGTGPTQIGTSKYYNYGAYFSDQIKIGKHWRYRRADLEEWVVRRRDAG